MTRTSPMRISDIVNFSRTGHISQPKSWKGQVKKLIIRNGFAESSFTFKEFFNHIDTITSISIGYLLGKCFPDSNTIRSSVRHTLQKLRDEEFLTFIDYKGTYKVSEVVRDDLRNTRAMTGQKLWRGYLARKEVKRIRDSLSISSDDEEFGSFVRNYHSNEYRRGAKKPRPTNHIIAYGYGIEGWI